MKFKVLAGEHRAGPPGGVMVYQAGDVVESDVDLALAFRGKFRKAEDDDEVSEGTPAMVMGRPVSTIGVPDQPPEDLVDAIHRGERPDEWGDEGDEEQDERPKMGKKEKEAALAPAKRQSNTPVDDLERKNERKAAKEGGAQAKKPAKASAPDDEESGEDEDVTDDFKSAKDNDLKVKFVEKKGYQVYEGDKVLNDKHLKSPTKVNSFLKTHLGGK